MNSYFIRHTYEMAVIDEAIDHLWNNDKVAIFFPNVGDVPPEYEDCTSLDENDYQSIGDKTAIRIFSELNKNGGYIWSEYRAKRDVKIGKVITNSFKIYETKWRSGEFNYERKAKLKTLQLDKNKVKIIKPYEAMSLRVTTPRQGTIRRWPSVGDRLMRLVENMPEKKSWENLSTFEQEVICAEYLRSPDVSQCPSLKRCLLPVGRTLKDIDIYGYASDGKRLFAQVTFFEKENSADKIKRLKLYDRAESHLIFFCDCNEADYENNILFIPVKMVFDWLNKDKEYLNMVFNNVIR